MEISDPVHKWVKQLEAKYGERRRADYQREQATVTQYLQAIAKQVHDTYTIEKPLAVGGTGIVFVGAHKRLPQQVAIKFNRPNLPDNEVSMVENESRVLPTLNHPNIIRVLDAGTIDGHH